MGVRKTLLDENASKDLLEGYGIGRPKHVVVPAERMSMVYTTFQRSQATRFPVVVKVLGGDIPHKTEVGAVRIGIRDDMELLCALRDLRSDFPGHGVLIEEQVSHTIEFIVGMDHDNTFGPVVMIGTGGVLTEACDDVTFRTVPLDEATAWNMIRSTKIGKVFMKYPGMAEFMKKVAEAMLALSRLAEDLGDIVRSVEVNPLVWTADEVLALDAKVEVWDNALGEVASLPLARRSEHGGAGRAAP